jgi:hypothetical protein
LLAAVLAGLFLAFRPAPFVSLVKRTFNPFVARAIATRTTLTLTEPAAGDATVTAGDPLTIAVDVGGSVPRPDGPDRLRLLVWHAADGEPDELPLEPGPDRDWRLALSPGVIQNGFRYRVVGGDAATADHTVTVRTRPLVVGFEARYVAPAYTRIPEEVGREPKLEGYRGTKVTLTARTNRPVKRGWLRLDDQPDPLPAVVEGDALRFDLTLTQSGSYRLGFTSTGDESSEPTPPYPVKVLTDQPPTLTITSPAEDEVTLPANGTLAVDAEAADDFGLTGLRLQMQVVAPSKFALKPRPYREGKDFRRADGTYPTRLATDGPSQTGYKETVPLASLVDTTGRPLPAGDGVVIEYWLEATDNCAEPRPNTGTSARKRLRLTPAAPDAPEQQAGRQAEQQKHEERQDRQLDQERRDPKQVRPNPDQPGEPGQAGEPGQGAEGKPEGAKPEQGEGKPQPKPGEGSQQQAGKPGQGGPAGEPKPGQGDGKPGETSSAKPDPLDEKAKQLQQSLDQQKGGTGGQPVDDKQKRKEMQQALDDLTGTDEAKREAARKKLDDAVGEGERKRIEKLQQDLKSDDPQVREQAKKDLGELDRETGSGGAGVRGGRPDGVERLTREAEELSSPDPDTRRNAEERAGRDHSPEDRDALRNAGEKLRSGTPEQKKQAEDDIDQLAKKKKDQPKPPPAGGEGGKPSAEQVRQQANDLTSPDDARREAAEKAMDGRIGKPERQKLQQQLGSQDRKQQQAGKEQVERMAEQAGGEGQKPTPDQVKEMADTARDLNSTDPARKAAAEKKVDDAIGSDARKQLQQDLKDLQSGDPAKKAAAEQKVRDAAEKLSGQQGTPTPEQVEKAAEAARDLTSPDPAKKADAEKQLDDQIGPDARKRLQQELQDRKQADLQGQKQDAAAVEQAAKEKGDAPSPEKLKELTDAAKELNSTDPAKKAAAEKKLDDAIGQGNREKLQQQQAGRQPDPQAVKDATQKAMTPGRKPDPKEAERQMRELADTAKDLTSSDPAKKAAAEKKLDDQIGPGAREKIQKEMQDLQSQDPKTREAARQRLKEAMDQLRGQANPTGAPGRGGSEAGPETPFADDPRNRLRTAELQLKTFKEARGNDKFLKEQGYTQAEFDTFLAEYERRVEQLRQEAAKATARPAQPAGPPTVKVGEGSTGPLTKTGDGTTGGADGGKPTPGYTDAQRKFAERAAKAKKQAEGQKQP